MAEDVKGCSFLDFWSKYQFTSNGRPRNVSNNQKTRNRLVLVTEPMVVVPKPSVPLSWSKPGHKCRPWYCECMLKRHRPFASKQDFEDYISLHHSNFEVAFQVFATSDSAPSVVKDAFARWVAASAVIAEVVTAGTTLSTQSWATLMHSLMTVSQCMNRLGRMTSTISFKTSILHLKKVWKCVRMPILTGLHTLPNITVKPLSLKLENGV